jgi:6-phosphogluconolactonase
MTRLTTCADAEGASARAAQEIARLLERAREERGVAHVALSGGTTPARAYELLAQTFASWEHIEVWFADERCVEPDDEQSNYRMARETLLAPAEGLALERVHRMQGELGPSSGALLYQDELSARIGVPAMSRAGAGADVPALDVIVLGIGPDGHIASLFPRAATLEAPADSVCLGVEDSPKPPPERITLSLAMLRAARRCVLLATGAAKADAVSAMLGEPSRSVPASLLRRERLSVFLDDAAAPGGISHSGPPASA